MLTFDRAKHIRANLAPAVRAAGRGTLGDERAGRVQVRQVLAPPRAQAKLTVGPPGDAYEREADRVADAVMRMPDLAVPGSQVQRVCAECEEELRRQPAEESDLEDEEEMRRRPEGPGNVPEIGRELEADIQSLGSGGQPLPDSERAFFEARFGRDLGDVRVHADTRAASLARSVNARAFTLGRSIAFGEREYTPGSAQGRRLLAHELTHVLQQGAPGSAQAGRVHRKVAATYPTMKAKLSYSAVDWAVTEAEAHAVLVDLNALSAADLTDTIAELKKDGLLERLLDNMSAADRTAYSALFVTLWNASVPSSPSLATQADTLGGEALTMQSYDEYQSKTWSWFFSPNDKLIGRASKPSVFSSWTDWDTMHWQSRTVIADLAGVDASRLARTPSNLSTLQAAYASWPASKFAVFQSGTSATNTCNVFLGDSLFLDGKNQTVDGKYYSAEDVYNATGAFTQIPPEAVTRGDIAAWDYGHVEIVTSVNVPMDEFCSRGGYRPPIGSIKCGRPARQISSPTIRFLRVK